MTNKERILSAKLLELASEEFGNHCCNDVDESYFTNWTTEERQKFVKEYYNYNGSPEDYNPKYLLLPDFALMGFLSHKLLKEK